jgi:tetratricopeptide (TPR) repeat protein
MTQLICPSRTYVSSIPLHRRILEVMKEKGPHYSQIAMAKRLGISRETFRNMMNGQREIYQFELEWIAKDLKVSVERLTQEDAVIDINELGQLLHDLKDMDRARKLADFFLERAIGQTERCDAHMFVGRAYFILSHYEVAHHHRLVSYEYALKLQDKYGETERLHEALKFLLTSYTVRKDYANAKVIVEQVQGLAALDPISYGALYYSLAMIAYESGNFEEAKLRFVESLDSYRLSNEMKEIGRAEHCLAFLEYKMGNFSAAQDMFEKAITTLDRFIVFQLVAIKDYLKVLLKQDDYSTAKYLAEKSLERLQILDMPILKIKFQLLASIATSEPHYAMAVLDNDQANNEHKILACRILMKYYNHQEDAFSVMRYYRIMEGLIRSDADVMGEGDL